MENEPRQTNPSPSEETLAQIADAEASVENGSNQANKSQPLGASLASYSREALRALAFLTPNWPRLTSLSPLWSVIVILAYVLIDIVFSRLEIDGPAYFYPATLVNGWLTILVLAWCAWWVAGARESSSADSIGTDRSIDAGTVFLLCALMQLIVSVLVSLLHLVYDQDAFSGRGYFEWGIAWAIWLAPVVWVTLAIVFVLFRVGAGKPDLRSPLPAVSLLLAAVIINGIWNRTSYWYPDYNKTEQTETKTENRFAHLTPAALKAQSQLLEKQLAALPAQRPGVVDVYAITYAPYSSENVFLNESKIVLQVMRDRFGATDRTLQLVNHATTIETQPWATPENLATALKRLAEIADPAEDIVFLHLTSHGSKAAALETSFWPLQIETLDAAKLRTMLDEANVASRVISVSACYSGTWLPFHQTPNTLIMTASDTEHTSYGCGYKSEITYFTRAMFDEQLRNNTRSFEDALKAARPIIEAREKEAGKSDGFSNPQIFVGDAIRGKLDAWGRELEKSP